MYHAHNMRTPDQPNDRDVYDRLHDAFVFQLGLQPETATRIVRRIPHWLRHQVADEIAVTTATEESINQIAAEIVCGDYLTIDAPSFQIVENDRLTP